MILEFIRRTWQLLLIYFIVVVGIVAMMIITNRHIYAILTSQMLILVMVLGLVDQISNFQRRIRFLQNVEMLQEIVDFLIDRNSDYVYVSEDILKLTNININYYNMLEGIDLRLDKDRSGLDYGLTMKNEYMTSI